MTPVVEVRAQRERQPEGRGGVLGGAVGASPTSVLIVVLDDIGVEWFDWHGLENDLGYCRTPFLSACSQVGVWFDRASAEPTCGPTRSAIQTGQLANRSGFTFNVRDPTSALGSTYLDFGYSLPDSTRFLAELVREVRPEVATGHFGKWHMCDAYSSQVDDTDDGNPPNVNLSDPARFGYQVSKGNLYNVGGSYTWWKVENGVVQPYIGSGLTTLQYPTNVNATDASAWLAQRTGPFLGYVAFGPPHAEFTVPPSAFLSDATIAQMSALGLSAGQSFSVASSVRTSPTFLAGGWKAPMEAVDRAIEVLWSSIPAKIRAHTWLVVIGDNGTVSSGLPPGYVHTKRELFWGGTRVPLVVRGPGVARPGRRARQIVHAADLYATVCDILNVERPRLNGALVAGQDSVSFMPVLRDVVDREDVNALRSSVVVQSATPVTANSSLWTPSQRRRAVFDGRWRLLNEGGTESLYDEGTDPTEEHDVIGSFPAEAERLRALLNAQVPV